MHKLGLSNKSMRGLLLAAILSNCNPLCAAIVLDFEGAGDRAAINDFYNGGKSGSGSHGRNYGVHFSSDAIGLIDADTNFNFGGNFAHEPSPSTVTFFQEGGDATLNAPSGFDGGFSFFYSYASHKHASVDIYDGQNGTGSLLGSIKLKTNFDHGCGGDPFGDYCHWNSAGVSFKGKAKSVVFGGPAEYALYDNLTLGSAKPGQVPVPGAVWFMGSGLLMLSNLKRRTGQSY
jgi:hypothetical protein